MKTTIKDVAKAAGVTIGTVSRVLNQKDRVAPQTRERVWEAVRKLNFEPDPIARTMIIKTTQTVGVLLPTLSNEYWAQISEAIQDTLWDKGYSMMLGISGNNPDREKAVLKAFQERRMDGIIMGPLSLPDVGEAWDSFLREKPVVSIDQKIPGIALVSSDNRQGVLDAVDHLIGLGHKEIAYIHGITPNNPHLDEREAGYKHALQRHGLQADEALIRRVEYGIENGFAATKDLLDGGKEFSAIFCWNDLLAIGAINALVDTGRRVPQDVAVIGYDDIHMAGIFRPTLTTVRQAIADIGSSAVELLINEIQGKKSTHNSEEYLFPVNLIVRESCGGLSHKIDNI